MSSWVRTQQVQNSGQMPFIAPPGVAGTWVLIWYCIQVTCSSFYPQNEKKLTTDSKNEQTNIKRSVIRKNSSCSTERAKKRTGRSQVSHISVLIFQKYGKNAFTQRANSVVVHSVPDPGINSVDLDCNWVDSTQRLNYSARGGGSL